ncbi:hypothetical protein EJ05DRAFT_535444 [Pseudovirgaria hyperparasitica]|uniref:Uncharacterized protein n=1 Tax=Pseudovirgaria hyperparasitica TaxID=470096 RepID=A0A6A6WJ18_9PEZI|nr:uncharacterized protein EJ05DRAFT_535444 [Pseudovirgaria hyperparasitica]KAF2762184.1 hypothetical protein EJ05DRAFT_535444 [Pseudovirgaria hyperparasitica]
MSALAHDASPVGTDAQSVPGSDLDAQKPASSTDEGLKSNQTCSCFHYDLDPDETDRSSEFDDSNLPPVVILNETPWPEPASPLSPSEEQKWEPLFGLSTDTGLPNQGIKNMAAIVELLREAGIVCCMSYEPALRYYGAKRLVFEWIFCIPTEHVESASQLIRERTNDYEPFRHPDTQRVYSLDHFFPRFKIRGHSVFFTFMSSQALNIPCTPENVEFSPNGIPYPKLHVYTQSLIDTYNVVDLVDLIDGMDLSIEWGKAHLNLEGPIDVAWGRWTANFEAGGQAPPDMIPRWCADPPSRLSIWLKYASAERKWASRGFKALPNDVTRFRKRGQGDPRLRQRDWC